jgi:hypothetical protein
MQPERHRGPRRALACRAWRWVPYPVRWSPEVSALAPPTQREALTRGRRWPFPKSIAVRPKRLCRTRSGRDACI